MDTAGQEDYVVMQELWIKKGRGFILVFTLEHQESLYELKTICDKIKLIKGDQNIPIILVGNKSDLKDTRKVTPEEAQQYAHTFGAEYFESSAKLGVNVD